MTQRNRIHDVMLDGQPRTLDQIAAVTGIPPQSVSARLRELRAEGFVVTRQLIARGLYAYTVQTP